jgi:hypothetical protein
MNRMQPKMNLHFALEINPGGGDGCPSPVLEIESDQGILLR